MCASIGARLAGCSGRLGDDEALRSGQRAVIGEAPSGVVQPAADLLRDAGERWFTEDDVHLLASLSEPIAHGFRRTLLVRRTGRAHKRGP